MPRSCRRKVAEANNNDLSRKEAVIGSGPFKLTEWVPDNYMQLDANRDFYLQGQPYLDAVRINVVPDQAGIVAALRTGAADMALFEEARTAQSLRQEQGITLDAVPSPNYNLLFVNTKRPPFDNLKVRQAMAYAIDRQQLIDAIALGDGEPTGPLAPALTEYALPVSRYPSYTRDVARATAAAAGGERRAGRVHDADADEQPGLRAGHRADRPAAARGSRHPDEHRAARVHAVGRSLAGGRLPGHAWPQRRHRRA